MLKLLFCKIVINPPAFVSPKHEHLMRSEAETRNEQDLRTWTRRNITETLISLNVNTVDDIQQISAALAQCMVWDPPASFCSDTE